MLAWGCAGTSLCTRGWTRPSALRSRSIQQSCLQCFRAGTFLTSQSKFSAVGPNGSSGHSERHAGKVTARATAVDAEAQGQAPVGKLTPGPCLSSFIFHVFESPDIPESVKTYLLYLKRYFKIDHLLEEVGWTGPSDPTPVAEEEDLEITSLLSRGYKSVPGGTLLENLGVLGNGVPTDKPKPGPEKPALKKGFGATSKKAPEKSTAKYGIALGRYGIILSARQMQRMGRPELAEILEDDLFGTQMRKANKDAIYMYTMLKMSAILPDGKIFPMDESAQHTGSRQILKHRLECVVLRALMADDEIAPLKTLADQHGFDFHERLYTYLKGQSGCIESEEFAEKIVLGAHLPGADGPGSPGPTCRPPTEQDIEKFCDIIRNARFARLTWNMGCILAPVSFVDLVLSQSLAGLKGWAHLYRVVLANSGVEEQQQQRARTYMTAQIERDVADNRREVELVLDLLEQVKMACFTASLQEDSEGRELLIAELKRTQKVLLPRVAAYSKKHGRLVAEWREKWDERLRQPMGEAMFRDAIESLLPLMIEGQIGAAGGPGPPAAPDAVTQGGDPFLSWLGLSSGGRINQADPSGSSKAAGAEPQGGDAVSSWLGLSSGAQIDEAGPPKAAEAETQAGDVFSSLLGLSSGPQIDEAGRSGSPNAADAETQAREKFEQAMWSSLFTDSSGPAKAGAKDRREPGQEEGVVEDPGWVHGQLDRSQQAQAFSGQVQALDEAMPRSSAKGGLVLEDSPDAMLRDVPAVEEESGSGGRVIADGGVTAWATAVDAEAQAQAPVWKLTPGPCLSSFIYQVFKSPDIPESVKTYLLYLKRYFKIDHLLEEAGWTGPSEPPPVAEEEDVETSSLLTRGYKTLPGGTLLEKIGVLGTGVPTDKPKPAAEKPAPKKGFGAIPKKGPEKGTGKSGSVPAARQMQQAARAKLATELEDRLFGFSMKGGKEKTIFQYNMVKMAAILPDGKIFPMDESPQHAGSRQILKQRLEVVVLRALIADDELAPLKAIAGQYGIDIQEELYRYFTGQSEDSQFDNLMEETVLGGRLRGPDGPRPPEQTSRNPTEQEVGKFLGVLKNARGARTAWKIGCMMAPRSFVGMLLDESMDTLGELPDEQQELVLAYMKAEMEANLTDEEREDDILHDELDEVKALWWAVKTCEDPQAKVVLGAALSAKQDVVGPKALAFFEKHKVEIPDFLETWNKNRQSMAEATSADAVTSSLGLSSEGQIDEAGRPGSSAAADAGTEAGGKEGQGPHWPDRTGPAKDGEKGRTEPGGKVGVLEDPGWVLGQLHRNQQVQAFSGPVQALDEAMRRSSAEDGLLPEESTNETLPDVPGMEEESGSGSWVVAGGRGPDRWLPLGSGPVQALDEAGLRPSAEGGLVPEERADGMPRGVPAVESSGSGSWVIASTPDRWQLPLGDVAKALEATASMSEGGAAVPSRKADTPLNGFSRPSTEAGPRPAGAERVLMGEGGYAVNGVVQSRAGPTIPPAISESQMPASPLETPTAAPPTPPQAGQALNRATESPLRRPAGPPRLPPEKISEVPPPSTNGVEPKEGPEPSPAIQEPEEVSRIKAPEQGETSPAVRVGSNGVAARPLIPPKDAGTSRDKGRRQRVSREGGLQGSGVRKTSGNPPSRETSGNPPSQETSGNPPSRETSGPPPSRETSGSPPSRETSGNSPSRETGEPPPSRGRRRLTRRVAPPVPRRVPQTTANQRLRAAHGAGPLEASWVPALDRSGGRGAGAGSPRGLLKPPPRPRPAVPPTPLRTCSVSGTRLHWNCGYLSPDLLTSHRSTFKAAGMLIYTITRDGVLMVLLGNSTRNGLTLFGGKRQDRDNGPEETALRELSEETEGLLSHANVPGVLQPIMWYFPGLYAVYPHYIPYEEYSGLPSAFASRKATRRTPDKFTTRTTELVWIPLHDIIATIAGMGSPRSYPLGNFLTIMMLRTMLIPWLLRRRNDFLEARGRKGNMPSTHLPPTLPFCWTKILSHSRREEVLSFPDTALALAMKDLRTKGVVRKVVRSFSTAQSPQLVTATPEQARSPRGTSQDPGSVSRETALPGVKPGLDGAGPGEDTADSRAAKLQSRLLELGVEGVEVRTRSAKLVVAWATDQPSRQVASTSVMSQAMVLLGAAAGGYLLDFKRRVTPLLMRSSDVLFPASTSSYLSASSTRPGAEEPAVMLEAAGGDQEEDLQETGGPEELEETGGPEEREETGESAQPRQPSAGRIFMKTGPVRRNRKAKKGKLRRR